MKKALHLLLLLNLLFNLGWAGHTMAEDKTSTLTFTKGCNGSGTADDKVTWTVKSDASEQNYYMGIHYGTDNSLVSYVTLTTTGITGIIKKIVVCARAAAADANVSIKVGPSTFGGDAQLLTDENTNYTFEGNIECGLTDAITVSVKKAKPANRALYVKSIAVTYTPLNITGKGTVSEPYTVADALALVEAGKQTADSVYVKGIVASKDSYNDEDNSISFYISDEGSTTSMIEAFHAKGAGNAGITSDEDVAIGDIVLMKGVLTSDDNTNRLGESCYIASFYEREMEFDEDDGFTVNAGHNVSATISRTFNKDSWNSLVLPFSLTAGQVKTVFGENTKIAKYTGTTGKSDTYTLDFETIDSITANEPVFIYDANDANDANVKGVTVVSGTPAFTPSEAPFAFTGTYTKVQAQANDWYVSDNNTLYKATGSEDIKPMRAVFRPVSTSAATTAKSLKISLGSNTPTSISWITPDKLSVDNDSPCFNLAGQRVGKGYKGIIVRSGHKLISTY